MLTGPSSTYLLLPMTPPRIIKALLILQLLQLLLRQMRQSVSLWKKGLLGSYEIRYVTNRNHT